MKFAALLQKKHILINQKIHSAAELFSVAARILSDGTTINPQEVEKALLNRESLGSTCIGNGAMIPHARLNNINDYIICYIKPEKPLVINSGETVKHVFAIISSNDLAAFHLKVLKTINEIISSHLEGLEKVKTADQFIAIVDDNDISIESHLSAVDFAQTVPSVRETDLLSKAVNMMREQNWSHVPVTNESGLFLGTVDFLDILTTSIPDYALRLSDLSFLSEFEPIKQFFHKENTLIIKPYIRHIDTMIISEDVSYVEVFFLMVKHKHRFLVCVDKNGLFLGVIRTVDVINRILRA